MLESKPLWLQRPSPDTTKYYIHSTTKS